MKFLYLALRNGKSSECFMGIVFVCVGRGGGWGIPLSYICRGRLYLLYDLNGKHWFKKCFDADRRQTITATNADFSYDEKVQYTCQMKYTHIIYKKPIYKKQGLKSHHC